MADIHFQAVCAQLLFQWPSMMDPHLVLGTFVKELQSLYSNKVSRHMLRCQTHFVSVHQSSQKPSISAIKRDEEPDRACPGRLLQEIIKCSPHTLTCHTDGSLPVGRGPHSRNSSWHSICAVTDGSCEVGDQFCTILTQCMCECAVCV